MWLSWITVFYMTTAVSGRSNYQKVMKDYTCDHTGYEVHLFSQSPLIIYIANFVSPFERKHLEKITITNGTFARSNVASREGDVVSSHRTSQSTTVVPDAVTQCILERARQFQGLDTPPTHLEPIQLVKYGLGEQYHFHTDWFPADSAESGQSSVVKGGNRVSSFLTYVSVSDDIAGGGTNFPRLQPPPGKGWCKFVDCDAPWDAGVTFRPVEGNAVFWTNLVDRNTGDERVLHAGLPVARGRKLGMNIWTKQGPFN